MKDRKTVVALSAIAVAALIVIGIVLANGGSSKDTSGNSTASTAQNEPAAQDTTATEAVEATSVAIRNYEFQPKAIKVKVGQTVTWTNEDSVRHNVATEDGSPESFKGPLIAKSETYTRTFTKAGTYNYFCEPHPYMKATVVVTE